MTESASRPQPQAGWSDRFQALRALGVAMVFGMLLTSTGPVRAETQELDDTGSAEEQKATYEVGNRILEQFDNEAFSASWQDVGSHLRNILSEREWGPAISKSRRGLGKLESRSLHSQGFTDHLEGSAPGRVGVSLFNSKFEGQSVVEKVVLALEEGEWKLAGYFVMRSKPAPNAASKHGADTDQNPD